MYEELTAQAKQAVTELLDVAKLKPGKLFVVGCSSSEMVGALDDECAVAESHGFEIVNAIPQLHAGGSFAMTAWANFKDPVLVETIVADAGIDIGGTLIGMHLRRVAIPVRLSVKKIGEANILCARTRPKYIGGARAVYQEL